MAITWKFYADSGLTVELTQGDFTHPQSNGPHDRLIYFGSVATAKQLKAASDPGVDPVQINVADSASGSGLPATAVTLALTSGALGTNTPGAALSIGATLNSGVGGAVPVFVRVDAGAAALATYTDLSLVTNAVLENAA